MGAGSRGTAELHYSIARNHIDVFPVILDYICFINTLDLDDFGKSKGTS